MTNGESIGGRRWQGGARVARGYVILWAVALAFAFVAPGCGCWLGVVDPAPVWTPYGITAAYDFQTIDEVFGAEARASRIAPGDRLIAIDGVPVERIGAGQGAIRKALRR